MAYTLTPEFTTITLAVGETMKIPMLGMTEQETDALYWSISESGHARINTSGMLTAVAPGQATVTVKPDKGSQVSAKIKVHVVPVSLGYSDQAIRRLPIAISYTTREKLYSDFEIIDNDTFIRKYLEKGGRESLAAGLSVSEEAVCRMFREVLLSEVPGMTTSFGFYAASAGVRNVYDLVRVNVFKMIAVIKVLFKTIRIPDGVLLELPSDTEIARIIADASKVIATGSKHYYLVADGAPEPSYLFDVGGNFKTDSDVLNEGLAFVQNIDVVLPLPRTISGVVKMREKNLLGQMTDTVKPGYFVQLSGVSSPSQDKVEDEEDLCEYTDGNGRFCIVMPDRYNLQETVKITICEKKDGATGVARTRTIADSVPRMIFTRRASEVLESKVIGIKKVIMKTDENGNTIKTQEVVRKSWSQLQEIYYDISTLRIRNFNLERRIRLKIISYDQIEKKTDEIRIKRKDLYSRYKYLRDKLEKYRKNLELLYNGKLEILKRSEQQWYLDTIYIDSAPIADNLAMYENYMDEYNAGASGDGEYTGSMTYEEILAGLQAAQEEIAKYEEAEKALESGDLEKLREILEETGYFGNTVYFDKEGFENQYADLIAELEKYENDLKLIREDIEELTIVIDILEKDIANENSRTEKIQNADRQDLYGVTLSGISDTILGHSDEVAEKIRQKLMQLLAGEGEKTPSLTELELVDAFDLFLKEHDEDPDVKEYLANERTIKEHLYDLCGDDYVENDLELSIKRLFSRSLDADLGDFILIQEMFDGSSLYPRALPSVRLMGEDKKAVYLPTDTAPSRIFNYSMVQRLIEPSFSMNAAKTADERKKLTGMIDVSEFRERFYTDPDSVPIAVSLGMGYVLNMHQAWVPDGFALGNLLYSLVLAPGEEKRIIVHEHTESYSVSDEAAAVDTIRDTYRNNQEDNEYAAFSNAADRYSAAHSDYSYFSEARSQGKMGLKLCIGIGVSSSSSSTNRGSSSANASQSDTYSEVSQAAQSFQTEIKTESDRLASAKRTSIRIATSSETESVASRIVANHNHSHVMTVQYWEVMRRYRMETCIDNIDLVLFVPLKPVRFLPEIIYGRLSSVMDYNTVGEKLPEISTLSKRFAGFQMKPDQFFDLDRRSFAYRYSEILKHAEVLSEALPARYRGGLNLVKKYSAYPDWRMEKRSGSGGQKITLEITGCILEFDDIVATLHFANSGKTLTGAVTSRDCMRIDPSLNTRQDVLFGLRKLREGIQVKKYDNSTISIPFKYEPAWSANKHSILASVLGLKRDFPKWEITFTIPSYMSADDIDYISIDNSITGWEYRLSQNTAYLETYEVEAIARYEQLMQNLYEDDANTQTETSETDRLREGLPECYTSPLVSFTPNELRQLGPLKLKVKVRRGRDIVESVPNEIRVQYAPVSVDVSRHVPILRFNEVCEIEEMFHHVLSNTMRYSQAVWSSLTDDERIMMLEPYTVDMDYGLWYDDVKMENSEISLLNCVDAKHVIGYYGNCILLPFTYPKELADMLGKTAGDVQEELYRFHTTSFRVPSTVISVPTEGMVGEAVLGATNVSEKVDITRFWNWKDSEIDHIEIDQSSLNGRSLLENASTLRVDAPTQGVAATAHINGSGLLEALTSRESPTFANVLKNTDTRELLKSADDNASKGRESIVAANASVLKSAINAAASLGSGSLASGISNLAGVVGDTDIIKSALGSLGMSDEGASKLVDKISSGKATYSDIVQGVANEIKDKKTAVGGQTPPGEGTGGETPPGQETGGETPPGQETGGQMPGQETGGQTPPEQETGGQTPNQSSGRSEWKDIELTKDAIDYLNQALEAITKGETPESFYCRMTGADPKNAASEITELSDRFCAQNGIKNLSAMINSIVMEAQSDD